MSTLSSLADKELNSAREFTLALLYSGGKTIRQKSNPGSVSFREEKPCSLRDRACVLSGYIFCYLQYPSFWDTSRPQEGHRAYQVW